MQLSLISSRATARRAALAVVAAAAFLPASASAVEEVPTTPAATTPAATTPEPAPTTPVPAFPPPRITSVGGIGWGWIGGLVTIRGTSFDLSADAPVTVGGKRATILISSPNMIWAWAPPLSPGAYPLVVTTVSGSVEWKRPYRYNSFF